MHSFTDRFLKNFSLNNGRTMERDGWGNRVNMKEMRHIEICPRKCQKGIIRSSGLSVNLEKG